MIKQVRDDDEERLAAKIGFLNANPKVCHSMGVKACLCAWERFNQEKYGRDVEKILQRVVSLRNQLRESPPEKAASHVSGRAA